MNSGQVANRFFVFFWSTLWIVGAIGLAVAVGNPAFAQQLPSNCQAMVGNESNGLCVGDATAAPGALVELDLVVHTTNDEAGTIKVNFSYSPLDMQPVDGEEPPPNCCGENEDGSPVSCEPGQDQHCGPVVCELYPGSPSPAHRIVNSYNRQDVFPFVHHLSILAADPEHQDLPEMNSIANGIFAKCSFTLDEEVPEEDREIEFEIADDISTTAIRIYTGADSQTGVCGQDEAACTVIHGIVTVPEPSSTMLAGTALAGLALLSGWARRPRRLSGGLRRIE